MGSTVHVAVRVDTLRPRQNGRHFPDDIFKCTFLNETVWIPIKISPNFVPKGRNNNIPALVQIMAWRRSGDKALSEPVVVRSPTHICVARPQWVNAICWPVRHLNYAAGWSRLARNTMHCNKIFVPLFSCSLLPLGIFYITPLCILRYCIQHRNASCIILTWLYTQETNPNITTHWS